MKKNGFTLIELLVAIVIMGILVTLLMANYLGAQKRGRDARRKQDLSQVQKALEMYYNDKREYPDAAAGAISGGAWGGAWQIAGEVYMAEVPADPVNDATYKYYYAVNVNGEATNQSYALYSKLENLNDSDINDALGSYNYGVASSNVVTIPSQGGSPTD